MATQAYGMAVFTVGGAETASFSWFDVSTNAPVVFAAVPRLVFGPCQTVSGGMGSGAPYLDGPGALTTSGGTVTCANPPNMIVTVTAIG